MDDFIRVLNLLVQLALSILQLVREVRKTKPPRK